MAATAPHRPAATSGKTTGRLSKQVDANGNATEYAYEKHPGANDYAPLKKVTVPDALGVHRSFVYDARNRVTEVKNNAGESVAKFTWSNEDRILSSEDALTNQTFFEYQAHHGASLLKKITTPLGLVTQLEYDTKANLTKVTLPTGQIANLTASARNLTETATDALGGQTSYEYDARANYTQVTNALGLSAQTDYDDLDLPKEFTDTLGATSKYAWNALGQIKSLEDNRAKTSQFQYHRDGQRKKRIDPDAKEELSTYDPAGNLLTHKPRGGQGTITYTYDEADRITAKAWDNGLGQSGNSTYSYNAADQLLASETTTATGATFTQTWGYDGEGRVNSFGQNTRTVGYGYDATGRLSTISYPAGFTVSYHYDADGKLTTIKKNGTAMATYAYENTGRLGTRTLSNGAVTTSAYDGLDRVNSIILSKNAVPLWSHAYGFDAIGNRLWTQFGSGQGDVYQYDAASQLTAVKYTATNPAQGYAAASNPAWTATCAYDPASNRTTATEAAATTAYTVNAVNQYTQLSQGGQNSTPTYNTQGDLLTHAGWTYAYDANVHLISATDGTATAQYEYDGLGRRVGKKLGAQVLWHLNSGLNLIESYDVGASQPTSHIHEPGVNRPLATVAPNGNVTFHHQDILGNVIALTDGSGALIEEYRYSVWGKPTIYRNGQAQGDNTVPEGSFLFTGHQYDSEAKLHFARARTYSASLGRWLSRDPIGEEGGLNLYAYVENDPINWIDPDGLTGWQFTDLYGRPYGSPTTEFPVGMDDVSNFGGGLGDGLSLNGTKLARDAMGIDNVDPDSTAYKAGSWSSCAVGTGRLAYAGLAKAGSVLAKTPQAASAFREGLKNLFRGGMGKGWRPPNLSGKTGEALRRSAGRTNPGMNTYGAGVGGTGAYNANQ